MVYWLIILLSLLLMGINKISIKLGGQTNKHLGGRKVYIVIVSVCLVLIAGLRSNQVGADTKMYETLFNYVKESNTFLDIFYSWKRGNVEIGYLLLEYIVSRKFDYQIFLFLTAIISIVPVLVTIYRHSKNYWLSIFWVVALGYFPFMMNGIRQSIAIGICFVAFEFVQEKKLIKYLICIALAMLFHKSAILFLPVYWLDRVRQKKSYVWVYLALIASVFAVRRPVYALLNAFARQSFEVAAGNQGGYGMFALMMFTPLIGWFYYSRFLKHQEEYTVDNWRYLLMVSIPGLMWPVANLNAELNRMSYYYFIFGSLYIPSLLDRLKKNEKLLIGSVFLLVGSYYLYAYIIKGQLLYSPYHFFWE